MRLFDDETLEEVTFNTGDLEEGILKLSRFERIGQPEEIRELMNEAKGLIEELSKALVKETCIIFGVEIFTPTEYGKLIFKGNELVKRLDKMIED